jgi:hypothetical protein
MIPNANTQVRPPHLRSSVALLRGNRARCESRALTLRVFTKAPERLGCGVSPAGTAALPTAPAAGLACPARGKVSGAASSPALRRLLTRAEAYPGLRAWRQRQEQSEGRANAWAALHGDGAAVGLGELPGERSSTGSRICYGKTDEKRSSAWRSSGGRPPVRPLSTRGHRSAAQWSTRRGLLVRRLTTPKEALDDPRYEGSVFRIVEARISNPTLP